MTSIDPGVFQALTIASALDLYAKTGMRANRSYTPTNMIRAAMSITGKKFKSRDYLLAAKALRDHVGLPERR